MNRKRKYFLGILLTLILFVNLGCGNATEKGNTSAVFPLENLQTKDGEFQYKNVPFGSSSEEAMKQIPEKLEKMEGKDSSAVSYYSKDSFDFYGCDAVLFLDFYKDKLESTKIQFNLKEGEEQFQKILTDLTDLYGEPQTSGSEGESFTSEVYSWGKDSTRLQAILLKKESTASAVIGIFKIN